MWIYLGQGHAFCYWGQETSQVLTEPHGEGTGQGRHRSISLLLGLWPWYFGHQKGDTGWYWLPFTHFPTPPVIPSSRWWWYWSRAPCNPPAIAVEDQADVLIKEHCHHDEQRCPTQWYTVTDTLQVFWDWELFLQFWELCPYNVHVPLTRETHPVLAMWASCVFYLIIPLLTLSWFVLRVVLKSSRSCPLPQGCHPSFPSKMAGESEIAAAVFIFPWAGYF